MAKTPKTSVSNFFPLPMCIGRFISMTVQTVSGISFIRVDLDVVSMCMFHATLQPCNGIRVHKFLGLDFIYFLVGVISELFWKDFTDIAWDALIIESAFRFFFQ